jgi:thiol-disulfide isomerase/thioredoxin
MDNHEQLNIEKWVDDQMSTLQSIGGGEPNSEAALASLRQRQRQVLKRRKLMGMAGLCAIAAAIVFVASTRLKTEARLDALPDFELENIAGGKTTAAEFKGKVTIVDMWATWCEPCLKEIPTFNRLRAAYAACDVAVVGIAVESPYKDIGPTVREKGINYPVLVGNDEVVSGFGGLLGFPTTFVVNKDWKIDKGYMGLIDNKQQVISRDIDRLLGSEARCSTGL